MRSINENPTYRANRKYYGHDLSQHIEFTSTTGQLVPVYYDILNAGEKVNVKTLVKTRTQPLSANTKTKLEEHLEWFFVPINQIYKPFGNYLYGIQDFGSDFYQKVTGQENPTMTNRFPYITSQSIKDLYEGIGTMDTLKSDCWWSAFVRLAAHLGIPSERLYALTDGVDWSITPLLFCAYQKIWMDHYRDSNRIENDPSSYNLDSFFNAVGDMVEESGSLERLWPIFTMRYRPRKKDFYNNVFPSPIFGPNSVGAQQFNADDDLGPGSTLLKVNQWLTNISRVAVSDQNGSQSGDPTNVNLDSLVPGSGMLTYEFSRANVETLFAVDKLLEVTRRAGKHYDAQTLAHFGVKVPDNIEGQAYFLGRHTQNIVIGDVISQSDTSGVDPSDPSAMVGAPLGEIAGKGYSGQNSKPISFKAPCHGVLMCLYSVAPAQDYYQFGLDKLNCLINKQDYFVPEFDNLGMQPLFGYQCELTYSRAANSEVRGWQYRYMEFKQKIDRIFGGMQYTQKHWTAGINSYDVAGTSEANFYVDPGSLNGAVLYNYNYGKKKNSQGDDVPVTDPSELFQSDPFINEIFFDVKKASEMSTFGLMEL